MDSRKSRVKLQILNDKVVHSSKPMIIINRNELYDQLKAAYIINAKNNPASVFNITTANDYYIIKYFNNVA
ncbi:MAG: hypothetical protein JSS98_07820 [Bacteroidetes bacterium]|nr:hypothetical protein [Bacteroidota bacterium]